MRKLLLLTFAVAGIASVASAAPQKPASATIVMGGRVVALAADGKRAALLVSGQRRWRIVVWQPPNPRMIPIHTIGDPGCSRGCGPAGGLAIAGTRVAWDEANGGNTLETTVSAATLARRKEVSLGAGSWDSFGGGGDEAFGPTGDGKLLAFTVRVHCTDDPESGDPVCPPGREAGDVVSATVWRVSRRGRCPSYADYRPLGHCQRVARANGELAVLAVDAGRIVAKTDHGVRLLNAGGVRLRDLPVADVTDAALSGTRLALRVRDAFAIYDTSSGELVTSMPAQSTQDRLEDLDHGILVTAQRRTVTLRRLSDGKRATINAGGIAHAQLERPGLFVAGGRRVSFTPMAVVVRKLQ
jgi:hypothetical protein